MTRVPLEDGLPAPDGLRRSPEGIEGHALLHLGLEEGRIRAGDALELGQRGVGATRLPQRRGEPEADVVEVGTAGERAAVAVDGIVELAGLAVDVGEGEPG